MEVDIIIVVFIGEVIEEWIGLLSVVFVVFLIYVLFLGVFYSENWKGWVESGIC